MEIRSELREERIFVENILGLGEGENKEDIF